MVSMVNQMNPEERRTKLHELSDRLSEICSELSQITPELRFEVDRQAAKSILTDLAWAIENCTVMGLHQVGEAMHDAMGVSEDGKVTDDDDNAFDDFAAADGQSTPAWSAPTYDVPSIDEFRRQCEGSSDQES